MNNIGKAIKAGALDIPRIMETLQKAVKKYRPKMTETEKSRRKRKENYEWYKKEKDHHGFTVYYDRYRKGWFYHDAFGNRYGRYGSKDTGFDSRDKAISAIRRKYKKLKKEMNERAEYEIRQNAHTELIPFDAYPDPKPPTELDPIIIEYDAYCNKCRRDTYGVKAPSHSIYVEFWGGFEEDPPPPVNIAGWTKAEMQKKEGNFSLELMLDYKDLIPIYDTVDGKEVVIGVRDK